MQMSVSLHAWQRQNPDHSVSVLNLDDSSVINADTVEMVVAALTKDEEDADRERLQVG